MFRDAVDNIEIGAFWRLPHYLKYRIMCSVQGPWSFISNIHGDSTDCQILEKSDYSPTSGTLLAPRSLHYILDFLKTEFLRDSLASEIINVLAENDSGVDVPLLKKILDSKMTLENFSSYYFSFDHLRTNINDQENILINLEKVSNGLMTAQEYISFLLKIHRIKLMEIIEFKISHDDAYCVTISALANNKLLCSASGETPICAAFELINSEFIKWKDANIPGLKDIEFDSRLDIFQDNSENPSVAISSKMEYSLKKIMPFLDNQAFMNFIYSNKSIGLILPESKKVSEEIIYIWDRLDLPAVYLGKIELCEGVFNLYCIYTKLSSSSPYATTTCSFSANQKTINLFMDIKKSPDSYIIESIVHPSLS